MTKLVASKEQEKLSVNGRKKFVGLHTRLPPEYRQIALSVDRCFVCKLDNIFVEEVEKSKLMHL